MDSGHKYTGKLHWATRGELADALRNYWELKFHRWPIVQDLHAMNDVLALCDAIEKGEV